jgi:hypothetical protein
MDSLDIIPIETEFAKALPKIDEIFQEILVACGGKFWHGCGSYLFDGQTYKYYPGMYPKQLLLFRLAKEAKTAVEIGTYMGHSALLMLMANPHLRLTCIDISDEYSLPACRVLQKHFGDRLSFRKGDSSELMKLEEKFDLFHIDGDHTVKAVHQDVSYSLQHIKEPGHYHFVFDDYDSVPEYIDSLKQHLDIRKVELPTSAWRNLYYQVYVKEFDPVECLRFHLPGDLDRQRTAFYQYLWNRTRAKLPALFRWGNLESLREWRTFFPKAEIRGADHDEKLFLKKEKKEEDEKEEKEEKKEEKVPFLEEKRIKLYHYNPLSLSSIRRVWEECDIPHFEVIIGDGSQGMAESILLMEVSLEKLQGKGSVYIIENVSLKDVDILKKFTQRWKEMGLESFFPKVSSTGKDVYLFLAVRSG